MDKICAGSIGDKKTIAKMPQYFDMRLYQRTVCRRNDKASSSATGGTRRGAITRAADSGLLIVCIIASE